MSTLQTIKLPKNWQFSAKRQTDFIVDIEDSQRVKGMKTLSVQRVARSDDSAEDLGCFYQDCGVSEYLGKRIRMTAWVKSNLQDSRGQLYVVIHGIWRSYHRENGTFDNMWPDRIINGETDWTQYALVVDVPENSTSMSFGMYISGIGHMWLEDIVFEIVDKNVPLTGTMEEQRPGPQNLNFLEM